MLCNHNVKILLIFTAEDSEVVRKKPHMAANSEISIPVSFII